MDNMTPASTANPHPDILAEIIRRVFQIEDVTWGTEKQGFHIRYRGKFIINTEKAYDRLAKDLRPHQITPLFRLEDGQETIKLIRGIIEPKPSKIWVNILLFVLTVISMLYVGTMYSLGSVYSGPANPNFQTLLPYIQTSLGGGVAFTVSMLAILLAHEFGHYFVARYNNTAVSLPYFLPFPNLLGTLGAVILTKEIPRNKKVLLDIGVAGPLAGLVVTIPVLFWGVMTSELHELPAQLSNQIAFEGNSILYLVVKYAVHGMWLPQPANFGSLHPFFYWLRYFFTGTPLPHGGIDMTMNSVALAGWAGLLVTGLNLIPVGQLDGGHLIYGILGKKTEKFVPVIIGILLLLSLFWTGWLLWAVLILVFNRKHGEPLDDLTPLDSRRKMIAVLGLVLFILVFMPVPMSNIF